MGTITTAKYSRKVKTVSILFLLLLWYTVKFIHILTSFCYMFLLDLLGLFYPFEYIFCIGSLALVWSSEEVEIITCNPLKSPLLCIYMQNDGLVCLLSPFRSRVLQRLIWWLSGMFFHFVLCRLDVIIHNIQLSVDNIVNSLGFCNLWCFL